jgi:hypothetical protein
VVTYSVTSGSLPAGAYLDSSNGIIYWYRQPLTSTATALVSVTASAAGSGESITKALTLTIQPGASSGGGAPISAMLDFTLTGANPTFNTVPKAWGWAGPGPSLTGPSSAYFSLSWAGKSIPATGIRIILQSAGGASSNNDSDPDSSANSGALSVFDIGPDYTGTSLDFWLGPAGPTNGQSGNSQQNVNPRQISGINNPIGAYGVSPGQGGFAGNAAYDSAVLGTSNTILGYAEGGPATVNYDSRNENAARPYINTGVAGITSIIAANGPISPGRGAAAGNSNVPAWNFSNYPDAGTAYGRYSNVGQYGKGGREATSSGQGEQGFSAFVWVIIK